MGTARALSGYWSALHGEAVRLGVRELAIDLRELEFMSSGCFKGLVELLIKAQDLEPSKRYVLRFISDPTQRWQERSLHALRCFNVDLVIVTQDRRRIKSGAAKVGSDGSALRASDEKKR